MATLNKRFTISLTPELEKDLDCLKKNAFYNTTQSEMIRYVLSIGIKEILGNIKENEIAWTLKS